MPLHPIVRVAVVGEFDPAKIAHQAIPLALALAAETLGGAVDHVWIATDDLVEHVAERLAPFDAIWCAPGSPYASFAGALNAIRYAREHDRAYLGTCGGYQHALIEYARHVLGLADADHAESNASTRVPLIAPLQCALIETTAPVYLNADSPLAPLLATSTLSGTYHCRYGLNPAYQPLFAASGLRIAAHNVEGEPQAVMLDGHRFFAGVAFQPEREALQGHLNPLIAAFVRAAQEHHV